MTHSASEVFTMQLARAAAKQATKFLASRGLQKADRDDVIAAAMLWCWENRDNYSLTTTLETWFMNAIRDAYKSLQRDELPSSDESIDDIGGADDTYNIVAAQSAARALLGAMTPAHKVVAVMTMNGYTKEEMIARGIPEVDVRDARARIKQLRRLMPDAEGVRLIARTMPAVSSDNTDDQLSEIDVALEQLDFAPPAGKDCPPCWRCQWYYGFLPSGKRETRMSIEEPDVRDAVKNTEARKIEIAQQVRDGT